MKYEIVYTTNDQIWRIQDAAASHGYTQTQDCYWVQIFEDKAGNSIVCTRTEGELNSDPVERLKAMLTPQPAEENRQYCKRIVDEIEAYDTGSVWKCLECGEIVEAPSNNPEACPSCGEEMEQLWLYDWLADALDVEYTVDSNLDYKAAKIYVTLGGPTVWVDTSERSVKLAWGTDREEYPLDWDTSGHLDEVLEDEYNARRGAAK